jgi:hypothetical protein
MDVSTVKWLYDNGIFTLIQALLVFGGLIFTGYQLRGARRSFQATVISQISQRSVELQWEAIKEPTLQQLMGVTNSTAEAKRALFVGVILNHFATIYDLWKLGGLPRPVWRTFEADLRQWASQSVFQERWPQLREGHRQDFVALIDKFVSPRAINKVPKVEPTTERQTKGGRND